ncbi:MULTISPECIES: DUF4083 domain-containing protein [Peribacillus]|uniref:DUF4083 domain-containing protein n=1 Tax=Peribacillus TaxID=2675229 RepID=UPI001F4D9DF3|nr:MULTISPECIES: DUF4083 domain-containing protein [unclassified Peribacillus]MCK1981417.1 DUF4083 domain-containing protein [Peribacillus sp. Aquil_B1]MCK2006836.1 DUF4083 domain-containing protein [Peribacillus sp. Aquil_B8]
MDKQKKERGEVLLGYNIGDMVYQFIMFVLLCGMIFAVYFFVRSLLTRSKQTNKIEQKLDRVIEMLEKDKRD